MSYPKKITPEMIAHAKDRNYYAIILYQENPNKGLTYPVYMGKKSLEDFKEKYKKGKIIEEIIIGTED